MFESLVLNFKLDFRSVSTRLAGARATGVGNKLVDITKQMRLHVLEQLFVLVATVERGVGGVGDAHAGKLDVARDADGVAWNILDMHELMGVTCAVDVK